MRSVRGGINGNLSTPEWGEEDGYWRLPPGVRYLGDGEWELPDGWSVDALSPDGDWVAVTPEGKTLHLWTEE